MCDEYVPQVAAAYDEHKQNGLDIMIILGEAGYQGAKPNMDYCKAYAASHNTPLDKIFLDWGDQYAAWETTMTNINPYLGPNGEFGLPWDAVLDGDNMEFIQASTAGPYGSITDALNAALSD